MINLKVTQLNMFIQDLWARHRPGSSVDIATGYGLDGPWIESRWEARFSTPVQAGPGAHPASCSMGAGSFPGVKSGRSVTLTPHPILVPWSWKSRAIPLLPLWAVRPVQSLSACTRVHFIYGNNSCLLWDSQKTQKMRSVGRMYNFICYKYLYINQPLWLKCEKKCKLFSLTVTWLTLTCPQISTNCSWCTLNSMWNYIWPAFDM
jgi:hypothetical protein